MKKTLLALILVPALLFGAAFLLKDTAHNNAQEEHVWLMETLLPGGKDFIRVHYTGDDALIQSVHKCDTGFVIETKTRGYADDITMFIGVSKDGKVTGLVAYEAHETMGLGNQILTNHQFLSQFLNKTGSFVIGTTGADSFSGATSESASTGNEISVDGISGATVSSKAVVRCVNSAIAYVTGADIGSSATSWGG